MSKIEFVNRKSMKIRPSGRSTDYISPSFGHGCLYDCSYCYMKRHKHTDLSIAKNPGEILTAINSHVYFMTDVVKPNQTHEKYITYDISCNEDFALHTKHHDWKLIFDFFKNHDIAMGSFATKYVNLNLLDYNPEGKIRIRMSLMPEEYAEKLEPNTSPIAKRLEAINQFIQAGYDVHVNFSPVIYHKNWTSNYKRLFHQLNNSVDERYKSKVKAEVIFLTHNVKKHEYNLKHGLPGEDLIWLPQAQESKRSQYGGENLRYDYGLKRTLIHQFKQMHNEIVPWNTIRYIF